MSRKAMFLLDNGLLNGGTSSPTPIDVIDNVVLEFPTAIQSTVNTIAHVKALLTPLLMSKLNLWLIPPVQAAMPQATALATTSATKPAKTSTKTKKKKSTFNGLSRSDIIALLKQKLKHEEEATNSNSGDEEDDQEPEASFEASVANDNSYYPYN